MTLVLPWPDLRCSLDVKKSRIKNSQLSSCEGKCAIIQEATHVELSVQNQHLFHGLQIVSDHRLSVTIPLKSRHQTHQDTGHDGSVSETFDDVQLQSVRPIDCIRLIMIIRPGKKWSVWHPIKSGWTAGGEFISRNVVAAWKSISEVLYEPPRLSLAVGMGWDGMRDAATRGRHYNRQNGN